VTVDCGEEQRWSAIALFHHTGHGEIGIDRRCESFDAAPIDHTIERSAKARIQDFRIRNHDFTFARCSLVDRAPPRPHAATNSNIFSAAKIFSTFSESLNVW
jgi:hypothetical protein